MPNFYHYSNNASLMSLFAMTSALRHYSNNANLMSLFVMTSALRHYSNNASIMSLFVMTSALRHYRDNVTMEIIPVSLLCKRIMALINIWCPRYRCFVNLSQSL